MSGNNKTIGQKMAEQWKAFGKKTEWMESTAGRTVIGIMAVAMVIYSVVGAYETKQERNALSGDNAPQEEYRLQE